MDEFLGRFLRLGRGFGFGLGFFLRPSLRCEFLLDLLADGFGVHLVQGRGIL